MKKTSKTTDQDEILRLEIHFEEKAILNLFTERIMQEFEAQKDKLGSKKAVAVTVFMGKEKSSLNVPIKPNEKLSFTKDTVKFMAFVIGRSMALKFVRSLMFIPKHDVMETGISDADKPITFGEYWDDLEKKVAAIKE